jgi:hypothetical protein
MNNKGRAERLDSRERREIVLRCDGNPAALKFDAWNDTNKLSSCDESAPE